MDTHGKLQDLGQVDSDFITTSLLQAAGLLIFVSLVQDDWGVYIRKQTAKETNMIMKCKTCRPHAFQDRVYGHRMRVFNPQTKGGTRITGFRCTVCGTSRDAGASVGVVKETQDAI